MQPIQTKIVIKMKIYKLNIDNINFFKFFKRFIEIYLCINKFKLIKTNFIYLYIILKKYI